MTRNKRNSAPIPFARANAYGTICSAANEPSKGTKTLLNKVDPFGRSIAGRELLATYSILVWSFEGRSGALDRIPSLMHR